MQQRKFTCDLCIRLYPGTDVPCSLASPPNSTCACRLYLAKMRFLPFLPAIILDLVQLTRHQSVCACRLNLAEGRFLSPLPAKSPGINACGVSSVHGLFGCAGEDGVLECFDLRKRTSIGTLNAAAAASAVSLLPACLPAFPLLLFTLSPFTLYLHLLSQHRQAVLVQADAELTVVRFDDSGFHTYFETPL